MKNFFFLLAFSVLLVSSSYALNQRQNLPFVGVPIDSNGNFFINSTFNYDFVFSSSSSCTPVLLNYSETLTTNSRGSLNTSINITNLTIIPQYLCEYRNSTLRKVHTLFNGTFQYLMNETEIKSLGFNKTSELNNLYLGINSKASDSDLLDGKNSDYFLNQSGFNAQNITSGTIPSSRLSGEYTINITGNSTDVACTNCLSGTEIDETTLSGNAASLTCGIASLANDLSCTDCIGTTEISDEYVLNTGDTINGNLLINGNLTVIGTSFNATVVNQNLNGTFTPGIASTFTIGTTTLPWSTIYSSDWSNVTISSSQISDASSLLDIDSIYSSDTSIALSGNNSQKNITVNITWLDNNVLLQNEYTNLDTDYTNDINTSTQFTNGTIGGGASDVNLSGTYNTLNLQINDNSHRLDYDNITGNKPSAITTLSASNESGLHQINITLQNGTTLTTTINDQTGAGGGGHNISNLDGFINVTNSTGFINWNLSKIASSSITGLLSSSDWTTFNNKAGTGTASCSGSNSTHVNVTMNVTTSTSGVTSQCVPVLYNSTIPTVLSASNESGLHQINLTLSDGTTLTTTINDQTGVGASGGNASINGIFTQYGVSFVQNASLVGTNSNVTITQDAGNLSVSSSICLSGNCKNSWDIGFNSFNGTTASQSNSLNSTSVGGWTNLSNLTLYLPAGFHNIECYIAESAAAATTGVRFIFNVTNTTARNHLLEYYTSTTAQALAQATSVAMTVGATASSGTTISPARYYGHYVVDVGAVFWVEFATEINGSAVTVNRGSYCRSFEATG